MKAFAVVLMIILCASVTVAQSYSDINLHPYSRAHYGAASFKADSLYVWDGLGKWCTVTAYIDSTAGTTPAYVCFGNDSTNAIVLRPGTNSNYGLPRTYRVHGLTFIRQKGNVHVEYVIE